MRFLALTPILFVFAACSEDSFSLQLDGGRNDACLPKTCPDLGAQCGTLDNGCGTALDCGKCSKVNEGCTDNKCGCKPKTCAEVGANCGDMPDGCGKTLACGDCGTQFCGGGGPNKCGPTPCVPKTCIGLGKNCGPVSDGCSKVLDCGTCTPPNECGGGNPGVDNVCGCAPKTCAQLGWTCGSGDNGCGTSIACPGACASNETCDTTTHHCVCTETCKTETFTCGDFKPCGTGSVVTCGADPSLDNTLTDSCIKAGMGYDYGYTCGKDTAGYTPKDAWSDCVPSSTSSTGPYSEWCCKTKH